MRPFALRGRGTLFACVAVASAVAFGSDCLAPTEVLLDVSTDLDCRTPAGFSAGIATAPRGTIWSGQENGTETRSCEAGEVGTLALLPTSGGPFTVRVVGAVGYSARECATGKGENGDPDPGKPNPKHPDWGCITATRSLGFVPHRPLKLPVRLYASCLGKSCAPGTTCDATGACVNDAVGDCSVTGTCPEPGTSASASASSASSSGGGAGGAGGIGGAGGTGGRSSTASSSSAGGAGGSCGDTTSNPKNCGACNHFCLLGACVNSMCQPFALGAINGAILGGVVVDDAYVYVAATVPGSPSNDGIYATPKASLMPPKLLTQYVGARDLSVSPSVLQATDGVHVVNCVKAMIGCSPTGSAWTNVVLAGDPHVDAYGFAESNGQITVVNPSGTLGASGMSPKDIAVLGNATLVAETDGAHYFVDATPVSKIWGNGPASSVALSAQGSFGIFGQSVDWSVDNAIPLSLAPKEIGAAHLSASASGNVVWLATDASGTANYVRFVSTKSGGSPVTVAFPALPSDVAVDDKAAYWADNSDRKLYMVILP